MTLLGLDTATARTSVCVLAADGRAFEVAPAPGPRPAHGRELLPAVHRALEDAGTAFEDLDAVAVGTGPGGYTGLRIGISTARAIAVARALPVHAVSSLAALAAGAEESDRPVLAVADARRGEAFAALFEGGEERWPPFVAAPDELAARVRALTGPAPLAVGDGSVRFRKPLEAAGADVPPDVSPLHAVRALHVCRLALTTPAVAPEAVLPHYLRSPDAKPSQ